MGSYTPIQKFYKPAIGDLVNVDTDINYNWNRLDSKVKRNFEWMPTEEAYLTGNVPMENNFKYFKRYSNSKWACWKDSVTQQMTFYQDGGGFTPSWTLITPVAGFTVHPSARLMATIIPGALNTTENYVWWRGIIYTTDGSEIPLKTETLLATGIPAALRPTNAYREVQVQGGNSNTNALSTMVLRFNSAGEVRMWRYGVAQGGPATSHAISFAGVQYPKDT